MPAALSDDRRFLLQLSIILQDTFGGGESPGDKSTVDKLTYSSDTTARVPGANLSVQEIDSLLRVI